MVFTNGASSSFSFSFFAFFSPAGAVAAALAALAAFSASLASFSFFLASFFSGPPVSLCSTVLSSTHGTGHGPALFVIGVAVPDSAGVAGADVVAGVEDSDMLAIVECRRRREGR